MAEVIFKPGEEAPQTADYAIVSPQGFHTGEERHVKMGETFPPTPKEKHGYMISEEE